MNAAPRPGNACSQSRIFDVDDPLFGLYTFEGYNAGESIAPPSQALRNLPMTCAIELVRTTKDMYGALVSMGDKYRGFAAWMCHAGCVHVFAGEHSLRYGVHHNAKINWAKDRARVVITVIPKGGTISVFTDNGDVSSEQSLNWSMGDGGFTNSVLGVVSNVAPALTAAAPTDLQVNLHGGYVDSVKFFYNQRPRCLA